MNAWKKRRSHIGESWYLRVTTYHLCCPTNCLILFDLLIDCDLALDLDLSPPLKPSILLFKFGYLCLQLWNLCCISGNRCVFLFDLILEQSEVTGVHILQFSFRSHITIVLSQLLVLFSQFVNHFTHRFNLSLKPLVFLHIVSILIVKHL